MTLPTLNADQWHFVTVILIMVVCGMLGGTVNYLTHHSGRDGEPDGCAACISGGVLAALLVPLFLNMLSSDLLMTSKDDGLKLLIFAGFCLVAAVSARRFIGSVTDQVIRDAREAKQLASSAEEKAMTAEKTATQATAYATLALDADCEPYTTVTGSTNLAGFDADHLRLLKTLTSGRYRFRTEDGLATELAMDGDAVKNLLMELEQRGAVAKHETGSKWYWHATDMGRQTVQGHG